MKTYEITVPAPECLGGERTIKQQADFYNVDDKGYLTLLRSAGEPGTFSTTRPAPNEPVLVVPPDGWLMLRLVEDEA